MIVQENRLRTEGATHGDDVALEVAGHDAPHALVDDERRLPGHLRVRISLSDDPSWGVGYALIFCNEFKMSL